MGLCLNCQLGWRSSLKALFRRKKGKEKKKGVFKQGYKLIDTNGMIFHTQQYRITG